MQAVPLAGAPLRVPGACSTDLENDTERSKTEVRELRSEAYQSTRKNEKRQLILRMS